MLSTDARAAIKARLENALVDWSSWCSWPEQGGVQDIDALLADSEETEAALHAATQERDRQAARVEELTAAIEAFLSNGHLDRMADGSACYIVRGELPYVLLQEALEACALATPRAEVSE